jgi:cysteine desulfurase / selenocysteine lyase
MEHHSNILPWTKNFRVIYVEVNPDGRLDLHDLYAKIEKFKRKVKLVTVSGGSNVTGYIPPVHKIAEIAHTYGAYIAVDAAQLAAHRSIQMRQPNPESSLDFVVISSHKMYAPFGSGL